MRLKLWKKRRPDGIMSMSNMGGVIHITTYWRDSVTIQKDDLLTFLQYGLCKYNDVYFQFEDGGKVYHIVKDGYLTRYYDKVVRRVKKMKLDNPSFKSVKMLNYDEIGGKLHIGL